MTGRRATPGRGSSGLDAATRIGPYLLRSGVSHVRAAPLPMSRPGAMRGCWRKPRRKLLDTHGKQPPELRDAADRVD